MTVLSTDNLQWARDSCGDIVVPLRRATGAEAVGILVRAAVLLYVGEWFLDVDRGVKWLPTNDGSVQERDAILGQPYNPAKIRAELRRVILTVTGVGSVASLRTSFDADERTLEVATTVRTAFGDVDVNVTVPEP